MVPDQFWLFQNLGWILRNCRAFDNIICLKTLYIAHVRSILEYAAVIWSPRFDINIKSLEYTQRRFLKFLYFKLHGVYPVNGFSHELLLNMFELRSLADRRNICHVLTLHSIVNGRIICPCLLGKVSFRVPRSASRSTDTFYCDSLSASPIQRMCRVWNNVAADFDIFFHTFVFIKSQIWSMIVVLIYHVRTSSNWILNCSWFFSLHMRFFGREQVLVFIWFCCCFFHSGL